MSKRPAKMSHSPAQRAAWHAGKQKRARFYRSIDVVRFDQRHNGWRGAYTPTWLKRGLLYGGSAR